MELKPCPFCGSTDIRIDYSPGTFGEGPLQEYGAACRECSASFWYPDTNAPNADWNTRPIEDAQAAEIARLKAEVETERNRHRAWTDYFQTNQLTHAASRLEAAEDDRRRLKARVAELEGERGALETELAAYRAANEYSRYNTGKGGRP